MADGTIEVFARKIIRLHGDVRKKDIKNEMRAVVSLCMPHNCHKNIITVFECGCLHSPLYYIDMELCDFNLETWIYHLRDEEEAKLRTSRARQMRGLDRLGKHHRRSRFHSFPGPNSPGFKTSQRYIARFPSIYNNN